MISVSCFVDKQHFITVFLTMNPPQAVRQVILAVHRLVTRGDVTKVSSLLHAVWWRKGLKGKQTVVAVHLRWYICRRQKQFQSSNSHKTMQIHAIKNRWGNFMVWVIQNTITKTNLILIHNGLSHPVKWQIMTEAHRIIIRIHTVEWNEKA